MPTRHEVDEATIRQQVDKIVEGLRAKDLEGLKQLYATDVVSFDIERLYAVRPGPLQSLRYEIYPNHLPGAPVLCDASRHLADRPEPQHQHGLASGHGRVIDCLPGCRQNV